VHHADRGHVGHASHVRSCFPIKTRSYPAAVPRPVSCSRLRRKLSVIVYRASRCDQTIAPGRGKASPFRTLQCFSAIVACCSISDAEVGGGAVRRVAIQMFRRYRLLYSWAVPAYPPKGLERSASPLEALAIRIGGLWV